MLSNKKLPIDITLVRRLIAAQFPEWKDLSIKAVASSGWDNKTFHLGDNMLLRMPSAIVYADQVKKEQYWLLKLASFLPLPISTPLALGEPGEGYPLSWSIYRWIEGDTAASGHVKDLCTFAADLAQFLVAFQHIDSTNGPLPGPHSFYRGGSLDSYDSEVKEACTILKDKIDTNVAIKLWEKALSTEWDQKPVWVHGDISAGNLLVKDGRLAGIIDFGQLAVGDPACDLAIAWTFFSGESREIFRNTLQLDYDTWNRGKGWALWKALITAAGFTDPNNTESRQCWRILDAILEDDKNKGIKANIQFKPLNESHFNLMLLWFNKPHVQAFYSLSTWTYEEVYKKLEPYVHREKQISSFIIYMNDHPIGYIQSYPVKDHPWEKQDLSEEIIQEAAGFDLFIGEEAYLKQGLGKQIIDFFLKGHIWPNYQYCLVDPDIRNEASMRLFQKCGFVEYKQIDSQNALKQPVVLKLLMKKRENFSMPS